MLHNVGRKFIWSLIGSTIFATFIGYALYKAGLISLPAIPNSQRSLNIKDRNRNRRVGRIRITQRLLIITMYFDQIFIYFIIEKYLFKSKQCGINCLLFLRWSRCEWFSSFNNCNWEIIVALAVLRLPKLDVKKKCQNALHQD